jgi:hypothetical protein
MTNVEYLDSMLIDIHKAWPEAGYNLPTKSATIDTTTVEAPINAVAGLLSLELPRFYVIHDLAESYSI